MKRHGGNLNVCCYLNKANLKKLSDPLKGKTAEKVKGLVVAQGVEWG